jgi:hypothetical protein
LFGTSVYTYVVVLTVGAAPSLGYEPSALASADRAPYQTAGMHAAAAWLSEHARPDDLVMGSTATGNYLGGSAPGRVYVGHWVATLDYATKAEQATWFYSAPLDDERRAFLAANGVRWVVYGLHERARSSALVSPTGATPAFSAPGVDVFDARALVQRGVGASVDALTPQPPLPTVGEGENDGLPSPTHRERGWG